jgi:ABC-2 type transport system permease protein
MRASVGAFFVRDLRVATSAPWVFALQWLGILFAVATTLFVGELVTPGAVPGGYFGFAVMGMLVATFLSAAVNAVSGAISDERQRGTLEATLAAGIPPRALAMGVLAFPMASAVPTALVVAIIAVALGARTPDANWPLAFAGIILGAVSFAGLGVVAAGAVIAHPRGNVAAGWLVVLLAFAAGEFFPRELLPGWLESLGALSPVTWSLDVARAATLDGSGWNDQLGPLGILLGMAVAAWVLGISVLAWALGRARKTGSLGQY